MPSPLLLFSGSGRVLKVDLDGVADAFNTERDAMEYEASVVATAQPYRYRVFTTQPYRYVAV